MNTDFLVELSPLGLIEVSGIDAAKFLQGQLTCDVHAVTPEHSCLGAHCDVKGRVQFSFRLFTYQDNYYLRLPRELIPHALALLQKYIVFSKAKIKDVSDEWHSFGISGAKAKQYLQAEDSALVPGQADAVIATSDLVVLALSGPTFRVEILGKIADANLEQALSKKLIAAPYSCWQLLDIETGFAQITLAAKDEFTPHDLNYPLLNAVSFKKGCYTGQEIVARMQYLGKLKQSLYRLRFQAPQLPLPGEKLFVAQPVQEVGRIVSVVAEGENRYQALAVLQNAALAKVIYFAQPENIVTILELPSFLANAAIS